MQKRRLLGYVLFAVWFLVSLYVAQEGWAYYKLPLVDRPLDPEHRVLKPGGLWGHNLGVMGALLMILGVTMYVLRKRMRRFMTWGNIRVWLTVHIFLCVMGATLVTFHTAFKVGGLVAISFWCMVGVVLSGALGRYVYVRIPRDLRGQAMNASNLLRQFNKIRDRIQTHLGQEHEVLVLLAAQNTEQRAGLSGLVISDLSRYLRFRRIHRILKSDPVVPENQVRTVMALAKRQAGLQRSIHFYQTLQNVLHYWHVIHLPFTVVMFLVMIVHVGVAILFGHRWIF